MTKLGLYSGNGRVITRRGKRAMAALARPVSSERGRDYAGRMGDDRLEKVRRSKRPLVRNFLTQTDGQDLTGLRCLAHPPQHTPRERQTSGTERHATRACQQFCHAPFCSLR